MGFRLVPKSVTLNDLEMRNGRLVCVISPNSVALGPFGPQKWFPLMLIMYHTIYGYCGLKFESFFTLSDNSTRGHCFKIQKQYSRCLLYTSDAVDE